MCVEDGAFRGENCYRAHETSGRHGFRRKQAAEDIKHSRPGDGVDGVNEDVNLRVCSSEVDDCAAACRVDVDLYAYIDWAWHHTVIIETILRIPFSFWKGFDHGLHQALGASKHRMNAFGQARQSESLDEFQHAGRPDSTST